MCSVMGSFCRKHVVFGKLLQGYDILKKIEDVGNEEGLPAVTVKIINCGEHNEGENSLAHLRNTEFFPSYE
jgi:peptidyl-prolyl isomerase G (cyclophilin G)